MTTIDIIQWGALLGLAAIGALLYWYDYHTARPCKHWWLAEIDGRQRCTHCRAVRFVHPDSYRYDLRIEATGDDADELIDRVLHNLPDEYWALRTDMGKRKEDERR